MAILSNIVGILTQITRWLSLAFTMIMMIFIFIAVIGRMFNSPVLGDVELVQLMMIVLIMFSLAYTQAKDSHISIGLLVDRFPPRVQSIVDVVGCGLTVLACGIIGYINLQAGLNELTGTVFKTELLLIPHFPFKFIIATGLFLWGLEAFSKMIASLIKVIKGDRSVPTKGADELWL